MYMQVSVSVKRLREFLMGEELDPDNTDWRKDPPRGEGEKKRRTEWNGEGRRRKGRV